MKTIQAAILFAFILFFANPISAQYGNGYGNGYGGRGGYGGGMNGGMSQGMGGMGPSANTSKPKEIPVEVTVAKIMENMKPELNLDALQEIAVSNVLIESIKEQGILLKNESSSQDEKIKQIQALSDATDKRVSDFLSKDQREKYTLYMEQLKDQSSSKKSKKKKKKEKEQ